MQLPNYSSPTWGVDPHRRQNQHGQRNHRRRHWRLQLCEYRSIEQRCIASTLMTAFHPSRCSEKCCPTIIEFGIDSAVLASPLLDYRRRRLMTCPPALARMSLRTLRDVAAHQLRQSHQLHQLYSRINFINFNHHQLHQLPLGGIPTQQGSAFDVERHGRCGPGCGEAIAAAWIAGSQEKVVSPAGFEPATY